MKKHMLGLAAGFVGMLSVAGCGSGGSPTASNSKNLSAGSAPVRIVVKTTAGTPAPASPAKSKAMTEGTQALGCHIATQDDSATNLDITSLHMTISQIDIRLPDSTNCSNIDFTLSPLAKCETEQSNTSDDTTQNPNQPIQKQDKIVLTGPFDFDLWTGVSTPDLGTLALPSGIMKEIKAHVQNLNVSGTATFDTQVKPFNLNLDLNKEISFKDANGLQISETSPLNQILLSFDVSRWLKGVDLQGCSLSQDDSVDIQENSGACSNFKDAIEQNIETSVKLGKEDSSESQETQEKDEPTTADEGSTEQDSGKDGIDQNGGEDQQNDQSSEEHPTCSGGDDASGHE